MDSNNLLGNKMLTKPDLLLPDSTVNYFILFTGALASSEEVIPTPGDSMKDLDQASIPNAGGNFLK